MGEIVSLLTAVTWAAAAVLFTRGGHRVGAPTVNLVRLAMALVGLMLLHLVVAGTPVPTDVGWTRAGWLAASGLIGFALGDAMLFESMVLIGPRLAMLMMALWPVFAAVLAWIFLDQAMAAGKVIAMLVTLAGVALVVSDKSSSAPRTERSQVTLGILLGLGGALGQAIASMFSKLGMADGFGPISANLVRATVGLAALALWQGVRGDLIPNLARLRDRRATSLIALGAVCGPIVGVVLSLYAIDHARYLGVASTLMSLTPVILLPVSVVLDRERVGALGVAGTIVSLGGTAWLFL